MISGDDDDDVDNDDDDNDDDTAICVEHIWLILCNNGK